ncbi:MAG: COP23 domain-containing protein, partial [Xenococcaceae cyanobacterium]
MLRKSLIFFAGTALLTALEAVVSQPSYAYPVEFSCVMEAGWPTTMARNVNTNRTLPVIRWQSQYFAGSGFDNFTRCQLVSSRFQKAYNSGDLNYITAGI